MFQEKRFKRYGVMWTTTSGERLDDEFKTLKQAFAFASDKAYSAKEVMVDEYIGSDKDDVSDLNRSWQVTGI